ncbi:MAG: multicopper oxidase domain-containing protein [Oligoflexia bacterium]|nr:multicopper oxidase domain-containing protein [Oligoflexia bacterium]
MIRSLLFSINFFIAGIALSASSAESNTESLKHKEKVYRLQVSQKEINITGKNKTALVINDSLPAPSLIFNRGDKAVIYVQNNLNVETSIHWHGILLPNFEDGVPYLTSPPIRPGKTHKFEFLIDQFPGTYWYHSHTGLQEQEGLYGAFIIKEKPDQKTEELVLVLSDWTDEKATEVMRNLRRGSEWYAIKKGTALSLLDLIKNKALLPQLKMWKQRMPGMDISDVYYPAFLINGKEKTFYPHLKNKTRLRVVNASASTYFWLTFGGEKKARLISADGVPVRDRPMDKILHAIAETYDFIVEIPSDRAIEFKATAQDGSGLAVAILGQGELLKAPSIEKPNPIKYIKQMAEHRHTSSPMSSSVNSAHHKTHHHSQKHNNNQVKKMKETHEHHAPMSSTLTHDKKQNHNNSSRKKTITDPKNHSHKHSKNQVSHKNNSPFKIPVAQHYDHLMSKEKTNFSKKLPVREIEMNLTGNMWRYVWSINGKALSSADKIKVHKGEVLRLILNNTTMMHHPMHLHGHFFRVINSHGDYSPLKHTVDAPPMSQLAIEFEPKEKGDWFFHCHVLYHMKSGMSRVFKYGNERDSRLKNYSEDQVLKADQQWFQWAELDIMTHRLNMEVTHSNTKNKWNVEGVFSWLDSHYKPRKELLIEGSYEYFFSDFFRWSAGFEIENKKKSLLKTKEDLRFLGKLGFKYLLPYFLDFSFFINQEWELELALDYDLLLFSYVEFFAEGEVQISQFKNFSQEWELGLKYLMSQNFSLIGSYDNHFGWGAGLHILL